jgi:hypothetical protein
VAASLCRIGRRGGSARVFLKYAHDGIDRRIDLVQAAQHRFDSLARRSPAGADKAREIGRVVLPEVHVIFFLQLFFNSLPKKIMLPSRSATSKSRIA